LSLKVILAGFNTDRENPASTPETLSAAYARISRDPSPVNELRAMSAREVETARESNRRIVFDYGHGSVAEHAVFNLDVLGVSRLAVEALQSFRLASFTEKSQRYIRIGEDWHLPSGIVDRESCTSVVSELFDSYDKLLKDLARAGFERGTAREDARYLLPLAATSQMGMTVNARELEHMIRRLRAHPLEEVRALADALFAAVEPVAPSLMLFTTPSAMDGIAHLQPAPIPGPKEVELLHCDGDERVAAWLGRIFGQHDPRRLFEMAYGNLGVHDALPRAWELFRADFSITLSATAYAQMKRHRMCTQLVSAYDTRLGFTIPPSVREAGFEGFFTRAVKSAGDAADRLGTHYLLTNAHRRQIMVSMNGREFHHFCRLRDDAHAQWHISGLAGEMLSLASRRAPQTLAMTCGKSRWTEVSGKPVT